MKVNGIMTLCTLFLCVSGLTGCAQSVSRSLAAQGSSFLQQGRYADAENAFSKALKSSREEHNEKAEAFCLFNLSWACAHEGKYSDAQKLLTECEDMKPQSSTINDVELKKLQSNIYYLQAKYPESEALDKAVLAASPDTATSLGAQLHLSYNQYCQRRYADSESSLESVILTAKKLPPNVGNQFLQAAYKQLGKLHTWTSQFQKAQTDYENEVEVLRKPPESKVLLAAALNDLGGVLRARKSNVKALAYFEEAYEISNKTQQDRIDYLGNTGCVYLDIGDYKKAESAFDEALKLSYFPPAAENLAQCTSNLASVYAKQGRKELARRKFEEAIGLAEQSPDKSGIVMIKKARTMFLP